MDRLSFAERKRPLYDTARLCFADRFYLPDIPSLYLYGLAKGVHLGLRYVFKHPINRYFIIRNLHPSYLRILEDCFLYYQRLDPKNQRLFAKRVQKFIDKKEFVAGQDLDDVMPEMKVLIAASAIQITFGLPGIYFENFKEIHVHRETYFSEGMQQWNAGEVHKVGLIMLSWKDFLEGYLDPFNSRNVGLHEMAHAIRLENMIKNAEYGYFAWSDIELFNEYTVIESNKINAGEETIFRPYAAVYYQEFFAVLIEVFFEEPMKLKRYDAGLFEVTCRLLRQNPLDLNLRIR